MFRSVLINGGPQAGEDGYTFDLNNDGKYEAGLDNRSKVYYEVGETTVPVSNDYVLFVNECVIDNTKTENVSAEKLATFLEKEKNQKLEDGSEYVFEYGSDNTTIVVKDGSIVAIKVIYVE